jgi:hypothetical protein
MERKERKGKEMKRKGNERKERKERKGKEMKEEMNGKKGKER